MNEQFNDWWNGDILSGKSALFREDTPAFWAWEGWVAGVKAEREKLAAWMMQSGYATGHGDTIGDLLTELAWQIGEKLATEREGCAEAAGIALLGADRTLTERVLKTIRARSV